MEHQIVGSLLHRRVQVHLAGVGGNGAQMAHCLARLDIGMRALGHPGGLHVTAFDADTVSEANVGRQVYSASDVGQNKALLTVNRLNHFYGLDWDAMPQRYGGTPRRDVDLVISCVDSAAARRDIHRMLFDPGARATYWMDLGNTESSGQVVLGQPECGWGGRKDPMRLPCITELFPHLLDAGEAEEDAPSCSVRMSLASQGLFVNDMVVRWAGQFLYELFSTGRLTQHGVLVNLTAKRSGPIDVDPVVWKRFGVKRRVWRSTRAGGQG